MAASAFREIEPGVFELGRVRLHPARRAVSFPAVLNLDQGPLEYLLVTTSGKLHESVLRTEAEPYHVHTAMLLLGAKGTTTNELPEAPSSNQEPAQPLSGSRSQPIAEPSREALQGDNVSIEVSWQLDGKEVRRPATELVFNLQTRSPMRNGRWVYNGSRVLDGTFFAQATGSLVSLITDPDALVNHVGAGHENDQIWTPNASRLPPWNTPVQVTIRLEDPRPKR